jgi:hypothetical protein
MNEIGRSSQRAVWIAGGSPGPGGSAVTGEA